MKQQLLISCRGSEEVRSKCTQLLEKQLQSIPLQWKRSEAEFPVQVQLDVRFVAYSQSLIRKRESRWQDVAVAHLYFLDCWDSEKYRLDVRPDLIEWFATHRDADTNDWLVVFDASKARENRGRGQVMEKLRNDLSRYANRVVEIESAQKMSSLVRLLGDQALTSFDYWAQAFEAQLKIERDACFSLEWSFLGYMVTQVQYSRLLLSIGIFEQSLAQLDELDAMLSLLVSHYAASSSKARWIEAFSMADSEQNQLVSLVSLYSRLDDSVRHLTSQVDEGDSAMGAHRFGTDLRRIRALIFCCQLSVILNRYASQATNAETACQRVIWYGAILMQAIRKEEAILSGTTESGSPFRRLSNTLWCLELLHFAGNICDLAVVVSESESMCTLWMTLCRMVQNLDPAQLSSALGGFPKVETPLESDLPLIVLEKCMVDTTAYDEHFIRWHESAMAMLKHYGWRRHARAIGIALAEFYRRRGRDTEALRLFLKLARQLEEDRWCQAYIGLLLTIGDDLLTHCSLRERLKLFGDLSCAKQCLPSVDSVGVFCEKFKREFESDWAYERIPNSPVCPWFSVRLIKSDQKSILCGSAICWTVVVENRFPESMIISSASLCSSISSPQLVLAAVQKQRSAKAKKLADFRRESYSVASDSGDCSDLFTIDRQPADGLPNELMPGLNNLAFIGMCSDPGICTPEHLHIRLGTDGRLDVLIRIPPDLLASCAVKTEEPEITLVEPSEGESLWAGVTQTVKFRLSAGALAVQPSSDDDMFVRLETVNTDLQFNTSGGVADNEGQPRIICIELPPDLSPGAAFEIDQTLFCNIHGSNEIRMCEVISRWRGRSFRHQLFFKPIFHWMSNLKVIGERLLLTITLHNDGQQTLAIREPKLTFASLKPDGGDIDAELLNDGDEQDLYFAIPYTLAWYIPPSCTCLGVIVFHYQFKDCASDTYTCYADVALQKPAIVEACCQMASEKIVCRVGMACDFVVSLKALDPALRSVDVMVTLVFDSKFWACTSGMSDLIRLKENGLGQAFFQVIPQCVGFLPMPSVVTQLVGDVALTKTCQAYVRSKGKQVHVLAPLSTLRRSFNEKGPKTPSEIQSSKISM